MTSPSDAVHARRPAWAGSGSIGLYDARYLFERIHAAGVETIVELGTAAGVSTAILCEALAAAHDAGAVGPEYRVVSYDRRATAYMDPSRPTGDAIHEMLEPQLVERIELRWPANAVTVREEHGADEIGFLFIDASHRHPWPALDLLATLDALRSGAEVVFHDISLPEISEAGIGWGPKYVFEGLDVEKQVDAGGSPPNIGSVFVPEDKRPLREQLVALVEAHEWEIEVPDEYSAPLLGR
jgi:predicted O-methyltransferase YrrM